MLALAVAAPTMLTSQIRQYKFGRLTADDGLSSYRVYDVVQDTRGFLWIGTREGLNRYDGYNVKVFRHNDLDSTTISNDIVRSLLIDRSGTLWAGTDEGGVNKFDFRTEKFVRYINNPANSRTISAGRVTTLYEDKSGSIWLGTLGGGLNGFDQDDETFFHYENDQANPVGLSNDRVYAVCEDDSGKLWVGTDGGLNVLDKTAGTFTHYVHDAKNLHSLSNDFVRAIHQDKSGILWIATEGGGLNRFDRRTGLFTHYRHVPNDPNSLSHDDVSCIFEQDPRFLWIGTSDNGGGLNRLDRSTGRFVRHKNDPLNPNSLLHNYVRRIRADNAGVIWIVTDRGLSKIDRRTEQFKHYTHDPNILAPQFVDAICESRNGETLLIGTDGLKQINTKTGTMIHYTSDPKKASSLTKGNVQVIHEDRFGVLWVGSTGGGLDKLDLKSRRSLHYDMGLGKQAGYGVKTIAEESNGTLWIGTLNAGLLRYDRKSGQFAHYMHSPDNLKSLGNNAVFASIVDRAGTLWVGTEGGGLDKLDNTGEFIHFKHDPANPNSLSNDRVYALLEDSGGEMWISTGSGLNSFNRQTRTFKLVLPPGGLATGTITRIIEDDHGKLWLSTLQNGLFRFDPQTATFRQYDVHDGLQSNRFSYAGFKRHNGEIMFGGENGFIVFHPDSIHENTHIPSVVLTSFNIFEKSAQFPTSLVETREIRLQYNQNYFSFEFATLDLTLPEKNGYAYKLVGLDTGWVYPAKRRFAAYTNVDPGKYTLCVKGSNNDGVWNESGLSIPLIITPPFWATWWFRTLVAIFVIGTFAGAYNYRVKKLLEMERMRVRIASDLHDDIGSSLSGIALITDMVRNHLPPDQKDRQHLTEVSHAARHTADALKDIVWIISPEHDRLDDIVLRMKDSAAKLLIGIEYCFDCQDDTMSSALDMEFRRNVLLIYKETLNNIAKYSRATKVEISVKEDDKVLTLRVTDNGVGFDESTVKRGNGLKNLRARAAKIGGTIEIMSAPAKGTTVQLDARIP